MPTPILLVTQQLTQGGSERQLTETAKALDRQRFAPHVAALRPGGLRVEELRQAGVPIACFPVTSFGSPGALRAARHLALYIRERGIRLVHSFDTPANVFAVPVAKLCRVPALLSSQRCFRELIPQPYRQLLRATDRVVDAVVVNCRSLERHLEADEGVPSGRIRVCYNGIDTGTFCPGPRQTPEELRGAEAVIGVVCALRPEKDLATLVRAYARVRATHPGVRLLIVGDGPERTGLEGLMTSLGVRDGCVLVPATAAVAAWLREIDIFVLPSTSEALSNSLMEAMACGCAAVASRVGGNPELVADGERGLLFTAGDDQALAGSLLRLLVQQELRTRLAAAGREFIHSQFSLPAAAARMGGIYQEMLSRKGAA